MVWSDISRRIWSYIITKLGIFTNIEPSQLELSATRLRLNDLEVDHTKVAIPGMSTNKFSIGQIELELGVSGLLINANKVKVELVADKLESPDLAISMLMDATRKEINEQEDAQSTPNVARGSGGGNSGGAGNPGGSSQPGGGVAAKIADMALSQLSANITDIDIEIRVCDNMMMGIHIDQAILLSKNRLELESISINYTGEDLMAKSIYFDTSSSILTMPDLAFINRIVMDFSLDLMTFCVNVDHVRVSGVSLLKAFVIMMNDGIFETSGAESLSGEEHATENESVKPTATGEFNVNTLEVYESLDGSSQPLTLYNIHAKKSEFIITTLDLPEIVHINPFFKMKMDDSTLVASIDVPVSIDIPLQFLPSLRTLIETVSNILSDLELASDQETTKFSISLPELRFGIGNGIAVLLIFPQELSDIRLIIRELILTAADGQFVAEKISFQFDSGIEIEKAKIIPTPKFIDVMQLIQHHYLPDIPQDPTKRDKVQTVWNGLVLPNMCFEVRNLELDAEEWGVTGNVHCVVSTEETTLKMKAAARWHKSEMDFEYLATSKDGIRSITSELLLKKCSVDITADNTNSGNRKSRDSSKSNSPTDAHALPAFSCEVKLENDIEVCLDSVNTRLSFDDSLLAVEHNISASIPRIAWELLDKNGGTTNLFRAKSVKYKHQRTLSIGRCVLSTCADTHLWIKTLIAKFTPDPFEPKFKTEVDSEVNVLEGIEERFFVPSNLCEPQHKDDIEELDIHENYMRNRPYHPITVASNPRGSANIFELKLRNFQWQIFDGYDFEESRTKVLKESVAEEYSDDDSDEGDRLNDSMFITPQNKPVKRKQKSKLPPVLTRSAQPNLLTTIRRLRLIFNDKTFSLSIRDGKVSDLVPQSRVNDLLAPLEPEAGGDLISFTQTTTGNLDAPEKRVKLSTSPLRLSVDQDTADFIGAFSRFNAQETEDREQTGNTPAVTPDFIQRFEFNGLQLLIDYIPKKLDYKNLRSGTTAELLNVFSVKGAKLMLKPAVVYGKNGWEPVFNELLDSWMPDIKATQLTGLISGIAPIRNALRVTKEVKRYTVSPVSHTQVAQGAGAFLRRAMDELLKIGQSWLDSSDQALGGPDKYTE